MKLSDVPADASLVNSTMVLRKKPDKYKARLCACGNELKGQIADIYSPTIGALTYSVVHQIAVIDRMHVRIIDTVGAYLYQTYPLLCRLSISKCLSKLWKHARSLLMLSIESRNIFMVLPILDVLTIRPTSLFSSLAA